MPIRLVISILAIAVCLFIMQASARFGFSRLLSRYALAANSMPVADQAVLLSPLDPETYRTRAAVLNRLQKPAEAARALESALSLRYRDDYLWIELGNAREELGDTDGALAALDQAVLWAPYYAHTHWQRGNLLLRMGRSGDAFAELRNAASADRTYLPRVIDLAWGLSREDAKATHDLAGINDDASRLAFIRFLATKGKGAEAISHVHLLSTPLSAGDKNELVHLLVASKAFRDAFQLWSGDADTSQPALSNGGFEEPFVLNDAGFGWIVSPGLTKSRLAIDASEKLGGAKSLQITLDGDWVPGTPLFSQIVIVEPQKTYHLSFGVRTRDLVTGGPPVFTVSDGTTNQLFGTSMNLPSATSEWQKVSFEFTTSPASQAAVLRLQRNNCDSSPCPIFGTLWLDEISIEQTKPAMK
jgi:tetratricopeptide (TPR) repeat protein